MWAAGVPVGVDASHESFLGALNNVTLLAVIPHRILNNPGFATPDSRLAGNVVNINNVNGDDCRFADGGSYQLITIYSISHGRLRDTITLKRGGFNRALRTCDSFHHLVASPGVSVIRVTAPPR